MLRKKIVVHILRIFAEVGCQFPQFPFIAHSRVWSAEDIENNTRYVQKSKELYEGAQALISRAVDMAKLMVVDQVPDPGLIRGGRNGHELEVRAQI